MKITTASILARQYTLPVLSGLLCALALPPVNASFLIWVAFVPMLWYAADGKNGVRAIWEGGVVTGICYALVSVYPLFSVSAWWWLPVRGVVYENKILFLLWVLGGIILVASVLFGLFFLAARKVNPAAWYSPFLLGGLWALMEYGRSYLFAGFTWGHIGYIIHDYTLIVQHADWGGVYALGFIIITANILLYQTIARVFRGETLINPPWFRSRILYAATAGNGPLRILALLLVLVLGYGAYAVSRDDFYGEAPLTVSVVQIGVRTEDIYAENPFSYENNLRAVLEKKLDAVILPENIFPFMVLNEETGLPFYYETEKSPPRQTFDRLMDIERKYPSTFFVFGMHSSARNKIYNSMVVMRNGELLNLYHKRFLMPFAEGRLFNLSFLPKGTLDKGARMDEMRIKDIAFSPLICSEIIFPELLRGGGRPLIVTIGNDSVYRNRIVAENNHVMAKIRAIEQRAYVLRTMKTGVSSIIDPAGRVLAASKTDGEEILTATIYPRTGR